MAHDVFISYSEEDEAIADAICATLEGKGMRCWIASRDVIPGKHWAEVIVGALEESQILVLVSSANSNNSPQVIREVGRVASRDIPIIPFRIDNTPPSRAMDFFASSHLWIDAQEPPLESHLQKLGDRVQKLLKMSAGKGEGLQKPESEPDIEKTTTQERLRIIDTLEVNGSSKRGLIQLCVGDLTMLGAENAVDVLVVSAFRDDYYPMPGSLIGALYLKGISVEQLAEDKEVDLRQAFSCWMSREIVNPPPGIHFKRILCYEPGESVRAAELIGDIFRSLAPFIGGQFPVNTVATPLVASGHQGADPVEMLQLLVNAGVQWMLVGFPLSCLKIVCTPNKNVDELAGTFSKLKQLHSKAILKQENEFTHDVFISYAHNDSREIEWFEQSLLEHQPSLKLFVDRKSLNLGAAWQREIFESLDDCRKVVVFYSPSYLNSKVCIEEFNIALCRHRDSRETILMPIYLYSANLPTYMRLVQFLDCREYDKKKLASAVVQLTSSLHA